MYQIIVNRKCTIVISSNPCHDTLNKVNANFKVTGCRLWFTVHRLVQGTSQGVENSMQEDSPQKAAVLNSRTEYIMKCFHDMVDHNSTETYLTHLKSVCWSATSPLHIWISRTRGIKSEHKGTSAFKNQVHYKLHQVPTADPFEQRADLLKHGYLIIV